jgi:hypothetical protein
MTAIANLLKENPSSEVAEAARALNAKVVAVCGSPGGGRQFGGGGGPPGAGGAPRKPTFTAISGTTVRQLKTLDSGDLAPTEAMRKACAAACAEMRETMKSWTQLKSKDLPAFNALLQKSNLKPIASL